MTTCQARVHGTKWAYNQGCRCPSARAANRKHAAARRARTTGRPRARRHQHVDPIAVDLAVIDTGANLGHQERRQAAARLARIGMTALAIAEHVGGTERTAQRHLAALRCGA